MAKEQKMTPEKMEEIKLKELVERFNLLAKEFNEAGYAIQPNINPVIRIVKIEEKKRTIFTPFGK